MKNGKNKMQYEIPEPCALSSVPSLAHWPTFSLARLPTANPSEAEIPLWRDSQTPCLV